MKRYIFSVHPDAKYVIDANDNTIEDRDLETIRETLIRQRVCACMDSDGNVSFSVFDPETESPPTYDNIEQDRERVIQLLATMPGLSAETRHILEYAAKIASSNDPYKYIPAVLT